LRDYQAVFGEHGMDVEFYSRLWDNASLEFFSLVENANETLESITVKNAVEWFSKDENDPDHRRLQDYDAVIASAAFTSVRLRYYEVSRHETARTTPVVELFARAMADRRLIKGALCHGLWLATPRPENLSGRKVTCHEVVEADVINAGAKIVRDQVTKRRNLALGLNSAAKRDRSEVELRNDSAGRRFDFRFRIEHGLTAR
jgi:protease I